jgi:CRISPR system Cascade subunit CasE
MVNLLASPQVVHAVVENCFTRPAGVAKTRSLWRIDDLAGKKYLLVLSEEKPDFSHMIGEYCREDAKGESRSYDKLLQSVQEGSTYSFKLVANPVKEMNNKKVGIYDSAELVSWLVRKAEANGFKVDVNTLRVSPVAKVEFGRHQGEPKVVINKVMYEGILTVTDRDRFIGALTQGIGRAKAYGCGMLTIIPR